MTLKVSGGVKEGGIYVGNVFDKYGTKNPIAKMLMRGFEQALTDFVNRVQPTDIHEIGCGEGFWTIKWQQEGIPSRGCDFSAHAIELAKENALLHDINKDIFSIKSIYDLNSKDDSADLVVCCEVLEHLEDPISALEAIQRIVKRNLILSVPREPIWRIMNMGRGKYLKEFGNTPGHIQHWSKSAFIKLVSPYFKIIECRTPLPWTMLLCQPI